MSDLINEIELICHRCKNPMPALSAHRWVNDSGQLLIICAECKEILIKLDILTSFLLGAKVKK